MERLQRGPRLGRNRVSFLRETQGVRSVDSVMDFTDEQSPKNAQTVEPLITSSQSARDRTRQKKATRGKEEKKRVREKVKETGKERKENGQKENGVRENGKEEKVTKAEEKAETKEDTKEKGSRTRSRQR